MVDPALLVVGGLGASAVVAVGMRVRGHSGKSVTRIDPADLGLREFPELGAFVQYSAPASPSCRISLNRLAAAVAPHSGDAIVIEVHARSLGRVPTVLYVDRTGEVVQRWAGPPERAELAELLG